MPVRSIAHLLVGLIGAHVSLSYDLCNDISWVDDGYKLSSPGHCPGFGRPAAAGRLAPPHGWAELSLGAHDAGRRRTIAAVQPPRGSQGAWPRAYHPSGPPRALRAARRS